MRRWLPRRVARGAWPLLGAAIGAAVAVAVTLLQEPAYRADASLVLVRAGQPPGSDPELEEAASAAAELFAGRAVAASALANLGLDESPSAFAERLDVVAEPGSSLVRIEVEAADAEEARRAAQEVAEVATVLFNDRFGPQTVASVWEPADADPERVAPRPARNAALGALLGALAGWVALGLRRRRPAPAVPRAEPEPEPARPPSVDAPAAPPEPEAGPFALPPVGRWTLVDVERLVAEQGPGFAGREEEIELYLDTFRSVAGPDGRLPGDVGLVIEDVFEDLIARSGSTRRG